MMHCVELELICPSLTLVVSNYRRWIRDIEELQTAKINFALLSDADCSVLKAVRHVSLASVLLTV